MDSRLIYIFLLINLSEIKGYPISNANIKVLKFLATKIPRALNEAEWQSILSHQEYYILRLKGTERRWSSRMINAHKVPGNEGIFSCVACKNQLFSIDTKFNSFSGWPSFYQPLNESSVEYDDDRKLGYVRTEVLCSKCGGHLGHVFRDGPRPTGLRYCINGVVLDYR